MRTSGNRRRTLLLFALLATCLPTAARAAPPEHLTEKGRAALERGLARLAERQLPNGAWAAEVGYKLNHGYQVVEHNVMHVGVTGLAGLALLSAARGPDPEKYRENVEAAVRFLLRCMDGDGMMSRYTTRMYSHAFATLFLARATEVSLIEKLPRALSKAAKFIWTCQNPSGAWSYAPYSPESDLTATACQVLALRAARQAGVAVPQANLDRAAEHTIRSALVGPGSEAGGFRYNHREGATVATRTSFAITACGLATLLGVGFTCDEDIATFSKTRGLTGLRPTPRLTLALRYLRNTYSTTRRKHYFFYFGNFWAVQAMFTVGGGDWEEYFARVQRDLVNDQNADGSWPSSHVGSSFATASACLILAIPRFPPDSRRPNRAK